MQKLTRFLIALFVAFAVLGPLAMPATVAHAANSNPPAGMCTTPAPNNPGWQVTGAVSRPEGCPEQGAWAMDQNHVVTPFTSWTEMDKARNGATATLYFVPADASSNATDQSAKPSTAQPVVASGDHNQRLIDLDPTYRSSGWNSWLAAAGVTCTAVVDARQPEEETVIGSDGTAHVVVSGIQINGKCNVPYPAIVTTDHPSYITTSSDTRQYQPDLRNPSVLYTNVVANGPVTIWVDGSNWSQLKPADAGASAPETGSGAGAPATGTGAGAPDADSGAGVTTTGTGEGEGGSPVISNPFDAFNASMMANVRNGLGWLLVVAIVLFLLFLIVSVLFFPEWWPYGVALFRRTEPAVVVETPAPATHAAATPATATPATTTARTATPATVHAALRFERDLENITVNLNEPVQLRVHVPGGNHFRWFFENLEQTAVTGDTWNMGPATAGLNGTHVYVMADNGGAAIRSRTSLITVRGVTPAVAVTAPVRAAATPTPVTPAPAARPATPPNANPAPAPVAAAVAQPAPAVAQPARRNTRNTNAPASPTIIRIEPLTIVHGAQRAKKVTINGNNFNAQSVIVANGTQLDTHREGNVLTANIPTSMFARRGTINIHVANGRQRSGVKDITVR